MSLSLSSANMFQSMVSQEEAARRRADQKDYEPTNKSTIIEMVINYLS